MPEHLQNAGTPQSLVALYRETHYDVRLPGGMRCTVRIGQTPARQLQEFLALAESTFLVSACNPWSSPLTAIENRRRMRELLLLAKSQRLQYLSGVGHIPGQAWREPFLLLADTSARSIDDIASHHEQNAVVHLQAGQPARLRIYRQDWRQEVCLADDIEWSVPSLHATGES